MRPQRRRRLSFDDYLERQLDDARYMHGVMTKLWQIYDLNLEMLDLDRQAKEADIFERLTVQAPRVDRDDPLGVLRGDGDGETELGDAP